MLFDGISLVEGSTIQNASFATGSTFPGLPDDGELFYINSISGGHAIGVYVHETNTNTWVRQVQENDSILALLPDVITAGTYKSVTVSTKGIITSGTNPTTLAGFGITDGMSTASILNVLTSTATDKSLSAAQGKVLKDSLDDEIAARTALSNAGVGMSSIFGTFSGPIVPYVGTSRYYPSKSISINTVNAWVSTVSASDLVINFLKNGIVVQTVTIIAGQTKVAVTPVSPIAVTANDYLTISIISGTGADLSTRLDY